MRSERKSEDEPSGPACGTLRDVVAADLVAIDGDLVYHLDEGEGLAITDVGDPARPRTVARVPFVGTPLALYVRPPLAWASWVDWDVPGSATVVRALDIEKPWAPRTLGAASRAGVANGTALVGGVFYLMSPNGTTSSLASYRAERGHLALADEVSLDGNAGALAASPMGLATLTTTGDGVNASWIDLSFERPGAMSVRATRRLDGGFPAWEHDVVSADEEQAVRFLACATPACGTEEDAVVRVVDFARGRDDVRVTVPVRIGTGVPVARFDGDRLYVADGGMLRVVVLHPALRVTGSIPVEGMIAALRPHGTRVIAVGTVGTPGTTIKVAVHDIDVRVPTLPRLRGTAKFGEDWTWSRAGDDDRAISIDPTTELLAVPFSTWRARDGRYATGAQVIALGRRPPALREVLPAEGHVERVVFVKGRLLAVGGGTVTTLKEASERELEVR
jgi:hypothetical protein